MTLKHILLFAGLFLFTGAVSAQKKFREHPDNEPRNKGKAIFIHLTFGVHSPQADMGQRFGVDQNFGGVVEFLTANNFFFGGEGQFFFSNTVKEDPLAILRTPEGDIIGNNRALASLTLRERGIYAGGHVGRIFTFGENRSGIRVSLGAGILRHWIRLQDDLNSVTEITGDYKKGYDRLTQGFALNQVIAWQHIGKNRRINFFAGLEFNEGFTNTLRDWDFSEMRKLDEARKDVRVGIRVGWALPLYMAKSEEIYY